MTRPYDHAQRQGLIAKWRALKPALSNDDFRDLQIIN
jgi:hypothetical protein